MVAVRTCCWFTRRRPSRRWWLVTGLMSHSPHEIEIDAGEAVLQAGKLLAARLDSEVRISAELVDDAPAAGMLGVLDDAAMVVVGSRGLGGFRELLVGSTSLKLATHAPCPVIVVRDVAPGLEPGPEAGRVVVGVDDPERGVHRCTCLRFRGSVLAAQRSDGAARLAGTLLRPARQGRTRPELAYSSRNSRPTSVARSRSISPAGRKNTPTSTSNLR